MKRNFVTAVMALTLALPFAGPVAFAQADPAAQNQAASAAPAGPEQGHGKHMRDPHTMAMHLGKKLGLTADQTAKLEPILAERQQKMEALRGNASLTEEQRHTQMRAIGKSTQDELAGVLTPDQMEKVKGMRHHGGRGGDEKGEGSTSTPAGA